MNKVDLAKIIEKSLKGKVRMTFEDDQEIMEGVPGNNVMFDPKTMDPCIPIMVETDEGLRKGFTITITQP